MEQGDKPIEPGAVVQLKSEIAPITAALIRLGVPTIDGNGLALDTAPVLARLLIERMGNEGMLLARHLEGKIAGLAFRAGEVVHDVEQDLLAEIRHLRRLYEPTASGR